MCVHLNFVVAIVQSLSHVRLFVTQWTAAPQASLSITISWNLLKFMSIELVMPSNHLFLCHPLSSCPQSFSASESFPMSWLFASGGQNIGVSASVLQVNIQDWLPLGLTGSCSPRDSRKSSSTPLFKSIILWHLAFFMVQLTSVHDYWKNHSFD